MGFNSASKGLKCFRKCFCIIAKIYIFENISLYFAIVINIVFTRPAHNRYLIMCRSIENKDFNPQTFAPGLSFRQRELKIKFIILKL
jgi:hypothetical protein